MSMGGTRPDVTKQLEDDRHKRQAEHAAHEAAVNEIRPSWWKRVKSRLRRRVQQRRRPPRSASRTCGDTFPLVDRWGGQGSNLRPTDYESAALTD
jgi:hypothetical protein